MAVIWQCSELYRIKTTLPADFTEAVPGHRPKDEEELSISGVQFFRPNDRAVSVVIDGGSGGHRNVRFPCDHCVTRVSGPLYATTVVIESPTYLMDISRTVKAFIPQIEAYCRSSLPTRSRSRIDYPWIMRDDVSLEAFISPGVVLKSPPPLTCYACLLYMACRFRGG